MRRRRLKDQCTSSCFESAHLTPCAINCLKTGTSRGDRLHPQSNLKLSAMIHPVPNKPRPEVRKTKKELRAAHQHRMSRRGIAADHSTEQGRQISRLVIAFVVITVIVGISMFVVRITNRPVIQATITVNVPNFSRQGREGLGLFGIYCASCHGENAAGTPFGPALVDKLYGISNHDDNRFRHVIVNGVKAHHWKFGDMPSINISRSFQRDRIIEYVRELQRANNID